MNLKKNTRDKVCIDYKKGITSTPILFDIGSFTMCREIDNYIDGEMAFLSGGFEKFHQRFESDTINIVPTYKNCKDKNEQIYFLNTSHAKRSKFIKL